MKFIQTQYRFHGRTLETSGKAMCCARKPGSCFFSHDDLNAYPKLEALASVQASKISDPMSKARIEETIGLSMLFQKE